MEKLRQIKDQVSTIWSQFSSVQKGTFVGVVLMAILGFGWVVTDATQTDWKVLYSDLEPQTAAKITEELTKRQVPYKLMDSSTIAVPRDQVHQARLDIASTGAMDATAAGYELFDESDFGMTAFTQKVNFKRAMENELARTIKHIRTVADARVHLVMPTDALFTENQKATTASVVLKLHGGTLPPNQIQAIRHLVASAVEGMSPDNVTLVDQDGRLLARPDGEEGTGEGGTMETARKLEIGLEERITSLLTPVVGASGIRTKVNVELDTKTVVETAELFDPEMTAVRSEQRSEQISADGKEGAQGVPGIGANQNTDLDRNQRSSSKTDEVTNYEVSKRVVQTTQAGAGISRITVAVLVDKTALAADGVELAQIETLVKSAVGFEETRGDVLEVSVAPFLVASEPDAAVPAWFEPDVMVPVARYAMLGFLGLLLFLFVVRPITQVLKPAPALAAERKLQEIEVEIVGRRVGDVDDRSVLEAAPQLAQLRNEVVDLSASDLEKTAMILSHWIRTDSNA